MRPKKRKNTYLECNNSSDTHTHTENGPAGAEDIFVVVKGSSYPLHFLFTGNTIVIAQS